MAQPPIQTELLARIATALSEFLAHQHQRLIAVDEEMTALAKAAETFILGGGKRIRPAFAYWGHLAAGGSASDDLLRCVASLEVLQASALIHDDLMDDSDTRRGEPAIHRQFAARHRQRGWAGDPNDFGACSAILLGDLCMTWSDEMFTTSGMPAAAVANARGDFDQMRTEVSAGQYLDVLTQAQRDSSVARAVKVARFKSAKYTVERPLLLGGALAHAPAAARESFSAFGLPLGEAFQLRDDVLGVFGDPVQTGKPTGDDLREGKHTVLIAYAYENATAIQRAELDAYLGDADLDDTGVAKLRDIITDTGALRLTENRIDRLALQTSEALRAAKALFDPHASEVLTRLAEAAVRRDL